MAILVKKAISLFLMQCAIQAIADNTRRLTMTNKTYDLIRLIGEIAVPVIAFITAICTIWNIPHCAEVTATLTALDTLIGAVVMILRKNYNKRQTE